MNDDRHRDMHDDELDPQDVLDHLIMRVVEGDAHDGEWEDLATRAAADQSVWRLLATAQRDQTELTRLGRAASAVADRVTAPLPGLKRGRAESTAWTGWLGWAVAAVVFLALLINTVTPPRPPVETGVQAAGIAPIQTAQDALRAYLQKGQEEGTVLSSQPRRVILESRPNPAGDGYELIYIQQIMERAIVPSLYQIEGRDEDGRPSLARYQPQRIGRM